MFALSGFFQDLLRFVSGRLLPGNDGDTSSMRLGIGMRWWLAIVFAAIAAITAVAVAIVSANRSEQAFRDRAEELAAGRSFGAAIELGRRAGESGFERATPAVAGERELPIFVFSPRGRLLSNDRSFDVSFADIEDGDAALETALAGRRYVKTDNAVRATLVGIPFRREGAGALVTYPSHPLLAEGVGVVQDEVVTAALWAILLGGAIGFLVAVLIARRLAGIARAAAAIEGGDFDTALAPRFSDEVGRLSATIDRMRTRLRDSFSRLESERSRLEGLVERLDEGVIVVDPGLNVVFANGRARRLLEHPLQSGQPLPEPLRRIAERLGASGTAISETQIDVDGGRVYAIAGLPAQFQSENAIIVVRDISDRERRERAQREFVANAAHQLRSPLTTITGAVEILQAGAKESPEQRDRFLEHIERESERLVRLTRALLVLARAQTREESPRVERVSARALLESVAAAVPMRDGVTLTIDCDDDLELATEPNLVEQSLINLAVNAANNTSKGAIVLTARQVDGGVAIEVADSGAGMPRNVRERVFERFYRGNGRDAEGFGLGLAIVRESVRVLGGEIEVDSAPGAGTRVRVTLSSGESTSR
jgi:signal transduction histidine kinase/HAMP domain-containing protein